jgi:hypothetical protein
MGYPGNPVTTGPISVSNISDTYPTHIAELGRGGMRSVDTITNLNLISVERREFGMLVAVNADPTPANNKVYMLANTVLGGTNDTITDNSNWIEFSSGGTTETASNGLTKVGNDIRLGGTSLTGATDIGGGGFAMQLGTSANRLSSFKSYSNGGAIELETLSGFYDIGRIAINQGQVYMSAGDTNNSHNFEMDSSGFNQYLSAVASSGGYLSVNWDPFAGTTHGAITTLLTDELGTTGEWNLTGFNYSVGFSDLGSGGFYYGDDYSSGASDRWLVDKGYVDGNLLGSVLAAPTGTELGKSIRWNAGGTAWEYYTPGAGGGTVTNVSSANADITVATGTSTPVLTLVQSPALRSATTTIDVSASAAPTINQVLTATSGTTATWQTPASGFADPLTTNGDLIARISGATTRLALGVVGKVLRSDGTNSVWAYDNSIYDATNTGTTYTLVASDNKKILNFTNVAGCTVTLPNGLDTDFECVIYRGAAAGVITIEATSTFLESTATTIDTAKTAASVKHIGSDAWIAVGSLGASGGGSGTVTNVTSANADITVATGTSTPVITMVQAPALRSATTTIDVSAAAAPSVGQVLMATGASTATWQTPASGIITVGTTAIASGVTTNIIYNNGGTVGEYAISGSGDVAMTTSPAFTTPTLGVATATSVNGVALTTGGSATSFLNAAGTYTTPAGAGDMVLADAQTVTGAKTFLNNTLFLRNVAGTISSSFTNTNTLARSYTLQDASGIIAFTSDIPAPQTITLTGGVTGSGTGTFAATVITNANLTGHVTSVGNAAVLGSFTKAQLSTAVSDGTVLYVGDVTSNVSTALSVGTVGINTVGITSDGGADDVIIPAATVSTAGLLTTAKWSEIVANTAKVSNATHTGDVTGDTVLTIAAGSVDIAMLSATGTASSSTFLRGDNTWQTTAGFVNTVYDATHTGTTYSLVSGDNNKFLNFTNASGCTVTLTDGLSTDFECVIYRGDGAGTITLAAGATGTIQSTALTIDTAKTAAYVKHTGGDDWIGTGSLGSAAGGAGDMFLANIQTNTGKKTFNTATFALRNPANTQSYNFLGSAIAADRTVTLPLLTGNDEFTFNAASQALTNKSVNGVTLATGGTATLYLSQDGTYTAPAATGIGGALGAVDNVIPRSDGTGGVTLQASQLSLDDTGNLTLGTDGQTSRTIQVDGTDPNVSLTFLCKGSGGVDFMGGVTITAAGTIQSIAGSNSSFNNEQLLLDFNGTAVLANIAGGSSSHMLIRAGGTIGSGFHSDVIFESGVTGTPTVLGKMIGTTGAWVIGPNAITAGSVMADFQSTDKGVMMPRVTTIATVATPVAGMIAYDAATDEFNFREGGAWVKLGAGGGSGTVTNVSSANADITIATPTTTPVLTMVQAPALRSATTTIDVSAAAAPSVGQVLMATSSTAATWQTPPGGLSGSTGAVDNAMLRANGTGGSTVQSSQVIIDDSGNITLGTDATSERIITADGSGGNVALKLRAAGTQNVITDWDQHEIGSNTSSYSQLIARGGATVSLALRAKGNSAVSIDSLSGVFSTTFNSNTTDSKLGTTISGGATSDVVFRIRAQGGNATVVTGKSINLNAGAGWTSGNNNGGDIIFKAGAGNGTGLWGGVSIEHSGTEVIPLDRNGHVTESADFTLDESHRGQIVYCTKAGTQTVTMPTGFIEGWNTVLVAWGATTVIATAGTVVGKTATTAQYETIALDHSITGGTYLGV